MREDPQSRTWRVKYGRSSETNYINRGQKFGKYVYRNIQRRGSYVHTATIIWGTVEEQDLYLKRNLIVWSAKCSNQEEGIAK